MSEAPWYLNLTRSPEHEISAHVQTYFPDAPELARMGFTILCVLFSITVFLKYYVGEGTRKYQRSMYQMILFTIVVVQYYNLWFAVLKVPFEFDARNRRSDCLVSEKGGKVGESEVVVASNTNPCFCHVGARCVLSGENVVYTEGNVTAVGSFVVTVEGGLNTTSGEACLSDAGSECFVGEGNETISRMVSFERDCSRGRGAVCSKDNPCTPCGLDRAEEFGDRWARCKTCTGNKDGDCGFVQDVGPYCFATGFGSQVVPCERCCTEDVLAFDDDGVCY